MRRGGPKQPTCQGLDRPGHWGKGHGGDTFLKRPLDAVSQRWQTLQRAGTFDALSRELPRPSSPGPRRAGIRQGREEVNVTHSKTGRADAAPPPATVAPIPPPAPKTEAEAPPK